MNYCQWNPIQVQVRRLLFQVNYLLNILRPGLIYHVWVVIGNVHLKVV